MNEGTIRVIRRNDQSTDAWTTYENAQWLKDHFAAMVTFTPAFDGKLSFFPAALCYQDLYAIYTDQPVVNTSWILVDKPGGQRLYIPWRDDNGVMRQWAGDPGNPYYRSWWIAEAQRRLALGYRGLWIDDVNLEFRVSDGNLTFTAPWDFRTNATMTWDNWARYMAEFVEAIRNAVPGALIEHNPIWFARRPSAPGTDGYVGREISATGGGLVNRESGILDAGLGGGTGYWSLFSFFSYVDQVNARGQSVVFEATGKPNTAAELEYNAAGALLTAAGKPAWCGDFTSTPTNWIFPYDQVKLGDALGARVYSNGTYQRPFTGGRVVLVEPGMAAVTVNLGATYKRVRTGETISQVTLSGGQAAVLVSTAPAPPLPPQSYSSSVTLPTGFRPGVDSMTITVR